MVTYHTTKKPAYYKKLCRKYFEEGNIEKGVNWKSIAFQFEKEKYSGGKKNEKNKEHFMQFTGQPAGDSGIAGSCKRSVKGACMPEKGYT